MANDYEGIFNVLSAKFKEAAAAKKHKNWVLDTVNKDVSPEVAAPYATINTNISASNHVPTNLAAGQSLSPSNVVLNPGAVTLQYHDSLRVDLPSLDFSKSGSVSKIEQIRDEAIKAIGNSANGRCAAVLNPTNFNVHGIVDCKNYSENNIFNNQAITNNDVILTPAMAAAWAKLAGTQVPVSDGDLYLALPTPVYANQVQHPNWTTAMKVGDQVANRVSSTAILGLQWNARADFDPDLDAHLGTGGYYVPLYHKYSTAFVSRAMAPPINEYIPCTYVFYKGIPIRVVIDYNQQTLSDCMTFDVLYGVEVVRPDHGVIIQTG